MKILFLLTCCLFVALNDGDYGSPKVLSFINFFYERVKNRGTFAFEDDELVCNMKTCVIDLLDFNDFTFGALIKKIQAVVFCVKQCSPPIVHEFFESISFAFTKKISGKCRHMDCAEHNRFVALAHCTKKEAWPILQCTKKLFDLLQIPLEPVDPVNTTCSIVIETVKCLEDTFQKCGQKTFSLLTEIFRRPLTLGLNAYCHPSHKEQTKDLIIPANFIDLREDIHVVLLDDESDLIPVAKALKYDPNISSRVTVIETTQCLEETCLKCGERVLGLVQEILRKPLTLGLNIYCHPSYKESIQNLLTPPPPRAE